MCLFSSPELSVLALVGWGQPQVDLSETLQHDHCYLELALLNKNITSIVGISSLMSASQLHHFAPRLGAQLLNCFPVFGSVSVPSSSRLEDIKKKL